VLEFRILGPLEVYADDREITVGGAKQRALLTLLLVHPNEPLSTERLTDELWGEHPPANPAKTVHVHVSRLRRTLDCSGASAPETAVVTREHGYEFRVDPDSIDAHRFEGFLAEGRRELKASRPERAARALEAALGLWRGAPLADIGDAQFARLEAARLDDMRVAALEELIEAKLAVGAHAEVLGELEGLIAEQPYRERPRAQLMLALYRCDRQADALQAYQEARRSLVDELGIEPGERLRELERAILAQDPALAIPAGRGIAPGGVAAAASTFVGREPELGELLAGLDHVMAGEGRLFMVGGEPGIGKSRLANELGTYAKAAGAKVLPGRSWEAGGAPAYWPWVQALREHVRDSDAETLRMQLGRSGERVAAIVPELVQLWSHAEVSANTGPEGDRFRLFESIAAFLREVATFTPIVVLLDDLHAADVPSLLLLQFLAGQLAGSRILVLGCYRDTEVGPDLRRALAELAREAAARRLALTGLSGSETARLLELTMNEAPTDELATRVHEEAQGNPLFASEIGRLLAASGSQPASQDRLPIPDGIREAVGRRVEQQSVRSREVLTLASVVGREFELPALSRLSGLGEEELLQVCDEAAAARLIDAVPGAPGRLRFSHILIRDALYEDLSASTRLRLHRAVGETLEALTAANTESRAAELAHHYNQCASLAPEKAIEYAQRAGDLAASQLGYEEAARHYANAVRLLDEMKVGEERRKCDLLLALGDVLSRAGSEIEAKLALERAAGIAERAGWPDRLARAALGYGGRFIWARASSDPALVPLLERALVAVGENDSPERVALLARLSFAVRDEPSSARRIRLASEALAMARRIGDPATLVRALECQPNVAEGRDPFDGRLAGANELVALAERIGDEEAAHLGHEHRMHALWTLGDRTGVEVEIESLGKLAERLRQPAQRWHLSTTRTMLALMRGDFERAEELIAESVKIGQHTMSWNAVVSERIQRFVLCHAQGRLAEVEEVIRRSVYEYPALPRFHCALAHLYAERGRHRDARAVLDEILSRDLGTEHRDEEWLFELNLLPDVCLFLNDATAADRLYTLLLPYERLYAQAPVEATFGAVARGLGVLATALRRFDDAESHFEVAIELERGLDARPWLAHAQHNLAAMFFLRGATSDIDRARASLLEALRTYRELGMTSWAKRASTLAGTAAPA
jgi:DNA-binding SARP family transcriptional activator/tetratricopeptide (TPR) repeat protein